MPTTTPKPPSVLGLLLIIGVLTLGLVAIVRLTPEREVPKTPIDPNPPVVIDTNPNPKQAACTNAGGKWIECGNPCHGKPGEMCITMCEPQCLCGGDAGWKCPTSQACTDLAEIGGQAKQVGVCRDPKTNDPAPTIPTSTSSIPDMRPKPPGMTCGNQNAICVNSSYFTSFPLTNPLMVTGTSITFENSVEWRLEDASQKVLASGFTMSAAPDVGKAGLFSLRLFLDPINATGRGNFVIYETSAKDGEPINEVRIPVDLKPSVTQARKIFLVSNNGIEGGDCTQVTAVPVNIANTTLPVEATLQKLLSQSKDKQVVTATDRLSTAIPDGTRLDSVKVVNGTATVVFSEGLESYGGGACNAGAIRAQIEATLKQFSTVQNVIISVQGKTPETSLQP